MPHELFAAGLHARGIFPKLQKCFYKELSNETFEDFLVTKFGLWIDTRSNTDNTLYGFGRTSEKRSILLRIEKAAESSDGNPSGILIIVKSKLVSCNFIAPRSYEIFVLLLKPSHKATILRINPFFADCIIFY